MKYNPEIHHRRSIRLKGYDYSKEGAYFITICTQNRECLFGKVTNGEMILNEAGEMIKKWWLELQNKFINFELDKFVIMPNHFHGIIVIQNKNPPVGAPLVGAQSSSQGQPQGHAPTAGKNVGQFIGAFKSLTTNEYIRGVKSGKYPPFEKRIWQRNYHEHIIRNEKSYEKIYNYIKHNPEKWEDDKFYVEI